MKTIVITGSTRGIGFSLAKEFLARGQQVVINGRSEDSVRQASGTLHRDHPDDRILGLVGDVSRYEDVQSLWERAQAQFGEIDIWINNAGIGTSQASFWDQPEGKIKAVVDVNLRGLMYGCKVALGEMVAQGHGELYNMEGLGSDGRYVEGLLLYGSTKRAVRYLTRGLSEEVQATPVIVGSLSPGMVMTDMITGPYQGRPEEWERAKRIFNILADRVETVTPWLADQVLENDQNGADIRWLTRWKVIQRFLAAPFVKRDLFEGDKAPDIDEG